MKGRVLIVAGSDSGGGAGIQADLKAVTTLGGMAMTAITALTAQNSLGVHAVHEIPIDFIKQQFDVVFEDFGADSIKTGMLHSVPVIDCVAALLNDAKAKNPHLSIVVDPVMHAKGGASLLLDEAQSAFLERILPLADVLTPNVPEAETLSTLSIDHDPNQLATVGKKLLSMGPQSVLMKGGHLTGDRLVDVLVTKTKTVEISPGRTRIDSPHTHGTGCTLASALACSLAQGMSLVKACERAAHYVDGAIKAAPGYGQGHGPIDHGWAISHDWR